MRPLALDIDGTITREDSSLDPRTIDALRGWDAQIVFTTGKVLPNATSLCNYVGIPPRAVAETGAIVYADDVLQIHGDGESVRNAVEEYKELGYSLGWGEYDIVNRWRETEVAVNREMPLEPLERVAERHGVEVVDTGYAYHVKSQGVDKGRGLVEAAELMGVEVEDFVAIGDSMNDVSTFEVAGESFAVANADSEARDAANHTTDASYADGFLEALDAVKRD